VRGFGSLLAELAASCLTPSPPPAPPCPAPGSSPSCPSPAPSSRPARCQLPPRGRLVNSPPNATRRARWTATRADHRGASGWFGRSPRGTCLAGAVCRGGCGHTSV